MKREYIVTLKKHEDLVSFYKDMEEFGGPKYVPNREVELKDRRAISRNTHYYLSDEEAKELEKDDRVLAVELTPEERGIEIVIRGSYSVSGDFDKNPDSAGDLNHLNWGLLHCAGSQSQRRRGTFGIGQTEQVTDSVTVFNNGENVDVVIVDEPVAYDHQEFLDPDTGQTRFVQYQWFNELDQYMVDLPTQEDYTSFISSNGDSNGEIKYYNCQELDSLDLNHGTHVAGTATGKTQGWARKSNIYSMNVLGSSDTGSISSSDIISAYKVFDYLRAFHKNKDINPNTGRKNLTVTNHSWGTSAHQILLTDLSQITSVYFRGVSYTNNGTWTESYIESTFGIQILHTQINSQMYKLLLIPQQIESLNADVEDAIKDGVIVITAAGNDYSYGVPQGHQDYNNTVTTSGAISGNVNAMPFNRGGSPDSTEGVINVGSISEYSDFRRSPFSNYGPLIDIFAPGSNIISSIPGTNTSSYGVLSGTSMASPQVAGIIACISTDKLEMNNEKSLQHIKEIGIDDEMADTVNGGGFDDITTLRGAPNISVACKNRRDDQSILSFNDLPRSESGVLYPRKLSGKKLEFSTHNLSYTLQKDSVNVTQIQENESFSLTLFSSNAPDGTKVYYTIKQESTDVSLSNFKIDDVVPSSNQGHFEINSGSSETKVFSFPQNINDAIDKGFEISLYLETERTTQYGLIPKCSIKNITENYNISVNNLSNNQQDPSEMNEGQTLRFSITETTGLANENDLVDFEIYGLDGSQVSAVSSNNNSSSISFDGQKWVGQFKLNSQKSDFIDIVTLDDDLVLSDSANIPVYLELVNTSRGDSTTNAFIKTNLTSVSPDYDDTTIEKYDLSSLNSVDENGATVIFNISSNVRVERSVNFSIIENTSSGYSADNIASVSGDIGTIVTWDSETKTGTFIPDGVTGSCNINVTMKTDNIVWDGNYFTFRIDESGSQFTKDGGTQQFLNYVEKQVTIVEQSPVNFTVSYNSSGTGYSEGDTLNFNFASDKFIVSAKDLSYSIDITDSTYGEISTGDFSPGLSGTFKCDSQFTLTITDDLIIENAEYLKITFSDPSNPSTTFSQNDIVIKINQNEQNEIPLSGASISDAYYQYDTLNIGSLISTRTSLDEDDYIVFKIDTKNIGDGRWLDYSISCDGDISFTVDSRWWKLASDNYRYYSILSEDRLSYSDNIQPDSDPATGKIKPLADGFAYLFIDLSSGTDTGINDKTLSLTITDPVSNQSISSNPITLVDTSSESFAVTTLKNGASFNHLTENLSEGDTLTVNITPSNWVNSSRGITYTLSGISANNLYTDTSLENSDIDPNSTPQNLQIDLEGKFSFDLTITDDTVIENLENFTITLSDNYSSTFDKNDMNITVLASDTSETPNYTITSDTEVISEKSGVVIFTISSNVGDTRYVDYEITSSSGYSLSGAQIGSGNSVTHTQTEIDENNQKIRIKNDGSAHIKITLDEFTDSSFESGSLKFKLLDGSGGNTLSEKTIVISDANPLSFNVTVNTVNDSFGIFNISESAGQLTIDFEVDNPSNIDFSGKSRTLNYSIDYDFNSEGLSEIDDITNPQSGNFQVLNDNSMLSTEMKGQFDLGIVDDLIIENAEYLKITFSDSLNPTSTFSSNDIIIKINQNDQNEIPLSGASISDAYYEYPYGQSNNYIFSTRTSLDEDDYIVFKIDTKNIGDGRWLDYSISCDGDNSFTVDSRWWSYYGGIQYYSILSANHISYSDNIQPDSNPATGKIKPLENGIAYLFIDLSSGTDTGINDKTLTLTITDPDSNQSISSNPITLVDTSPESFTVTTLKNGASFNHLTENLSEGDTLTVNITPSNWVNSSRGIKYSINKDSIIDADIIPPTTPVDLTVDSANTFSFNINVTDDLLIENNEVFEIVLSDDYSSTFDKNNMNITVLASDTSETPNYTITSNTTTLQENGGTVDFTVTSNAGDERELDFEIIENENSNNIKQISGLSSTVVSYSISQRTGKVKIKEDGTCNFRITSKTDNTIWNTDNYFKIKFLETSSIFNTSDIKIGSISVNDSRSFPDSALDGYPQDLEINVEGVLSPDGYEAVLTPVLDSYGQLTNIIISNPGKYKTITSVELYSPSETLSQVILDSNGDPLLDSGNQPISIISYDTSSFQGVSSVETGVTITGDASPFTYDIYPYISDSEGNYDISSNNLTEASSMMFSVVPIVGEGFSRDIFYKIDKLTTTNDFNYETAKIDVSVDENGTVTSITIVEGGFGYTSDNVGLEEIFGIDNGDFTVNLTNSSITSITIVDGGTGHLSRTNTDVYHRFNLTHSGYNLMVSTVDDTFVEPDEEFKIYFKDLSTSDNPSRSSFVINGLSNLFFGESSTTINSLNSTVPEYTISSDVNTVDEDGGVVVFDISSNVRDGRNVDFLITEDSATDNIESVSQAFFVDDFESDISGWTTATQYNTSYSHVIHSLSHDGTMKFGSLYDYSATSETSITHTNSGTQTNRIRINIPHIKNNNSKLYVYVWEDNTIIKNTGWFYLDGTETTYSSITANGDGTYSGYVEVAYTHDVDLNSEYKIQIGHDQISSSSTESSTYVGDVSIYNPSQNLGKSGAITPSTVDGSSKLFVTMKTDSVVYDGPFDITFSETGSEFKLDTDSDFTSDSITKTISMNDFSPVGYKVTSDVIQTTEGGSAINVTIEATNLSDIINISRALNLSTYHGGVSIPSTVDITTISAGEHSGSFIIIPLEDSLVYPDEVNITITDPQNSSSTFLVNPDSENEAPVVGTGTLTVTVIDNDFPEYTVSSDVNTVDEDGGTVVFDISSNVRKDGQSIGFQITETAGVNNIESVYQSYLYDDFASDISGWTTGVSNGNYGFVGYSADYEALLLRSRYENNGLPYAKNTITHTNSGTQTNRIRINIPHINDNASELYVEILKDGNSIQNTGWFRLLDTISSDFGVITANGDGSYSGYLEIDFTYDVDLNSTYELKIFHGSVIYNTTWRYTYIGDINIYNVSPQGNQGNLGKSGTITPSAIDGFSRLVLTMKTDSVVYDENTFDITFSETGIEFKLDTDSDFTSDSITKTININEFSPVDYKVTSDVIQTTEDGSAINVTIETTNLSDIINVSRTLNLSTDNPNKVSIPSTVDITTISAGEHSGSFVITLIDDNKLYPDEEVNITITDPQNSSSTFLVNPDSENEAPVVGTGTLTVTVIDNEVPEYTISSDVNTLDEDGGIVVFDISSNVRKEGQSIGFQITEDSATDNIENVSQAFFYDYFESDISGWTTAVEYSYYANVTHYTSHDGTMRFGSIYHRWSYAETSITHTNSGTQTNRIRINIPHITNNNSQMYVQILKNGDNLYSTGYQYLRDTISSDYGVITANGDGSYSGYVDVDYTDDVDLNSTYKIRIGHDQISNSSTWAETYIGDVNIYSVTQGNLGKSGTITPSAIDGFSRLFVKMKIDSAVYNGNTFDITFSETGSEFKLDTDSDFTSNQVTKTININEFSPVDYKVTSDVIQTTEGGSAINVTIEATNLSDIINVSRALNLSTDNPKVSIPSTVDITTISAGEHSGSFTITPLEDNLVYPDEVNITITDPINSSSTFLVNPDSENEAPVVGTGTLTVTVIDNDVPEYTISPNVNTVDEDGGTVVFDISSNVRKEGQSIGFQITEDSATDNIESVYQAFFVDNFESDISDWTTARQDSNANATYDPSYDGTMRFISSVSRWSYAETTITQTNSGNQTNRIRINIPHINNNNSQMYVQILKNGGNVYSTGYQYLRDTISSDFGVITANGDGSYSGYLEIEYTDDVDLNSTYKIRIGHDQISYIGSNAIAHVGDVSIYSVTQGNLGKSGTITPSAIDGFSGLVVNMKTDSAVYNGNTFDIEFSETGSKFKLDTDSNFTSDSVTKTININEFSPVDYKVTSDVIQTTEGGSAINVTIEAIDVVNVSRALNLSTDNPKVSIPSTVDITTISAGEHSGSFTITPLEDNILYPDEVNITITDPINSSSTFLVNPDSENEAPVVGTGTLTVTVIDNDVPEYEISSDVNAVDEDGGVVIFDISSNVRRDGPSIGWQITEDSAADNIESVYQTFFVDDFESDISGWTTAVENSSNANVTHSPNNFPLYDGTMRFESRYNYWSYAETPITQTNSGNQTNRIRINIPRIINNNSQMYVEIYKDGVSLYSTGYQYLRDTISSDFGVITANGDGSYSGYLEIEYTDDVDLNSEYKIRIGHDQISNTSTWAYTYVGDVNIYNVYQGNQGKSGTITPSEIDGSASITVTMKTDSASTPENTFDITFSESGSEFKLNTDSDFTSDSVTKTININEQG